MRISMHPNVGTQFLLKTGRVCQKRQAPHGQPIAGAAQGVLCPSGNRRGAQITVTPVAEKTGTHLEPNRGVHGTTASNTEPITLDITHDGAGGCFASLDPTLPGVYCVRIRVASRLKVSAWDSGRRSKHARLCGVREGTHGQWQIHRPQVRGDGSFSDHTWQAGRGPRQPIHPIRSGVVDLWDDVH